MLPAQTDPNKVYLGEGRVADVLVGPVGCTGDENEARCLSVHSVPPADCNAIRWSGVAPRLSFWIGRDLDLPFRRTSSGPGPPLNGAR